MATSLSPSRQNPDCWQCRFFAVSWDPRLPYACRRMGFKSYACRRMGFKSTGLPALEVLRTDGQHCHGFQNKALQVRAPSAPHLPHRKGLA